MKLCVFPNDPIYAYEKKGEIKERYYNPKNLFDELHIISFTNKDIEEEKVQKIAGSAKLIIHSVGKATFLNKNSKKNQVLEIVKNIKPDIIRSYNALLEGWIAAYCSQKLEIPLYVSLHVQYDKKREFEKSRNYKKFLALKLYRKNIEPFTLRTAKKITAVYKIIEPYVIDLVGKKPEILYNRIDLKRFSQGKKNLKYDKPVIISVGRLTSRKNHDCLIKAIKDLDVYLEIIGDGEEYENLVELTKKLKIENKVSFIKSVPNNEIQNYYKSSDIFVSLYNPEIEGLPMPVLEAMASGLPIIISKPVEGLSDGLEGTALFSEINPTSLAEKISMLLNESKVSKEFSEKALEKSKEFDGDVLEEREAEIYRELINEK